MSLSTFDKTVASIFDAVLDERVAPSALQAVAGYVGAAGAAYLLVNKLTSQVSAVHRWGCSTGSIPEYLTHYSKIDPFRPLQEKAGEWEPRPAYRASAAERAAPRRVVQ
jgi:hypothetical protein